MIVREKNETRLQYLSRVLVAFMEGIAGEETIDYDETTCDGACLAEDIKNEIEMTQTPSQHQLI